ncbi:MAG: hypothetical protein ACYTG2_15805 [Planctomycetota bacterium]
MKPLTADTDPAVEARLIAGWRTMSAERKFRAVCELTRSAESWSRSGLRSRHPGADDHELDMRLVALKYGQELVHEAYGWRA